MTLKTCILAVVVSSFLLGCYINQANGIIVSEATCNYIKDLIKQFKDNHGRGFSSIVTPPVPRFGDQEGHNDFHLPAVLLWNPKITHPHFFHEALRKCTQCGLPMRDGYWNDGSSATTQPRILHGFDNVVLLVSVVYTCDNNHRLLAHDNRVLQCIPSQIPVPFVLLYRTGFTRELVSMCTAFVRNGLNFHKMETLILEQRWESYARQQDSESIHRALISQEQLQNDEDFWDNQLAKSPSNDILSKCFLAGFLKDEYLYLREMTSIDTGDTISFDHTFKVAANIGYLRKDKVWVPQYDSLFIIMNSNGQVLTWQLTKGTSFSQIEPLLQHLRHRAESQQNCIGTVYIDDCCKLRNKIKSVLGKDVLVKLDIFHAVQRITRTLSKRNTLLQQCTQDLRLVFRKDGDCGINRMSHTPSSEVMLKKLQKFADTWKDAKDHNGNPLFKPDTFHAISNLTRHITAGCLSDIPPGGGTNRNERFHSHINSFFNKSRIGILLAYALLTVIMHSHNTALKTKGKCAVRPIAASPFRRAPPIHLHPIGIMPKLRYQEESLDGNEHWEIDLNESQIDLQQVLSIYSKSLQKLQISRSLAYMKLVQLKSDVFNFKPFQSLLEIRDASQPEPRHLSSLSDKGLVLALAPRDGNCFFKAVALNLMSESSNWTDTLMRVGILPHMKTDSEALAGELRTLFVKELVGERCETYKSFIEEGSHYVSEANKFLQDGFYDHALGDTMPLALATALQATIIIFTVNSQNSVMYVTPEVIATNETIFLVYDPIGSGHYDAALPYCDPTQVTEHIPIKSSSPTSCSCGINITSEGKQSCVPLTHYSTRCKCYKASKPCTPLCRCKNCCNPQGTKPPKEIRNRKRRHPHVLEKEIPDSKKFAADRGELISTAIWSDLETIVLMEICNTHEQDTIAIAKLYNDIVYYSTSCFCTHQLPENVVLREKTIQQINSKIKVTHPTLRTHLYV